MIKGVWYIKIFSRESKMCAIFSLPNLYDKLYVTNKNCHRICDKETSYGDQHRNFAHNQISLILNKVQVYLIKKMWHGWSSIWAKFILSGNFFQKYLFV